MSFPPFFFPKLNIFVHIPHSQKAHTATANRTHTPGFLPASADPADQRSATHTMVSQRHSRVHSTIRLPVSLTMRETQSNFNHKNFLPDCGILHLQSANTPPLKDAHRWCQFFLSHYFWYLRTYMHTACYFHCQTAPKY